MKRRLLLRVGNVARALSPGIDPDFHSATITAMTREEFDCCCTKLKATTHVVQWGRSSVWKVGGKIFAVCSVWGDSPHEKISFKCTDFSYRILIEQPSIVPAPYLARAKWVQVQQPGALSDEELKAYIAKAHEIISAKLTKAKRKKLGL